MQLSFVLPLGMALLSGALVRAEQHTIRFDNKCGKGTPQLIQNGKVLSTGQDYTSNGPFSAGECGYNGEKCALLEMTLVNPTAPGAGSSTDISLIDPHALNVPTSFSYFGGCEGQGATCATKDCKTAFFQPDDNQVQVQCESENVNLLITFCGDATSDSSSSSAAPVSSSVAATHSSSVAEPTSTKAPVASSTEAHSTAATSSITISSGATLVAQSSSESAAPATSSAASSVPSCKAGSRRRRRSTSPEAGTTSNRLRRHHARNAEAAAHRGASI
ncbi:hypothetical protein BD413DRAFT_604873 [Trametes elegans]|nr:hypothetical protein BD413DRAFT_604873 [Trametes elegans]